MIGKSASPLLELIRRVGHEGGGEPPDHELLGRIGCGRDDAAFLALLRRHGRMVLDVCRSVLGNEADAEDAFQATFLILARKAGAIRKRASVGSWLHGVAYRTSLKARAALCTRRKHESRAERAAPDPADLAWREVQEVIHAELSACSERYQAPLVLCYLEGKTQEEAAALLGVSRATVKKRLELGRRLLRDRLLRRGLTSAVVLALSAWPGAARACVPRALEAAALRAALTSTTGTVAVPGTVSVRVAVLADAMLKTMSIARLRMIAAVAVVGLLIGGAGVLSYQRLSAGAGRNDKAPEAARRIEDLGRSEPVQSLPITARITGFLENVAVEPGATVQRGELLFQIDARPARDEVEKAEAEAPLAEAKLKLAEADLDRMRSLILRSPPITPEDLAQAEKARAEAAEALNAARARLASAQVRLERTRITAPVDGKIGRLNVEVGNLIIADSTVLATIESTGSARASLKEP
ncbi:MAG: efflux RND transporter periplasmic adaptor subunit [Gemmataceae bacterium]